MTRVRFAAIFSIMEHVKKQKKKKSNCNLIIIIKMQATDDPRNRRH